MLEEDRTRAARAFRALGDQHAQIHALAHQRHLARGDVHEGQLVVAAFETVLDDRVVAVAARVDI